jgi:aspartyl-tRNA(Asn)/glutamyl-tRNA(Gln) amidotransferase subunit B
VSQALMADGGLEFEPVIGLEVHCELRTRTKLFCGCPNEFGSEPNTNVCPVCLGLPGSLPVLNAKAVELAVRIGMALNCEIRPSSFHRKNYFYPDMPKDYQISQYDEPINVGGWLELPDGSRVGIVRAHLEEDTGKTTHYGGTGRIHGSSYSLVDYNRAGVPLVEIVSAPDIRSAEQARLYAAELRAILVATGASDGRMEEGSMRVDANVSVRRKGSFELGTRCEVKNLNSLRSLGRAVDYEVRRQAEILAAGGTVVQETRHFDEERGVTVAMRSKEEAFDYRYFPEPDLVPLALDPAWQADVAASLGPMPAERRRRLVEMVLGEKAATERGSGEEATAERGRRAVDDQVATVVELGLDGLVEEAVLAGADPSLALARAANEAASAGEEARQLSPESFAALLRMEAGGKLSSTQAKAVLAEMISHGGDPEAIAKRMGFEALAEDELLRVVKEAVGESPEEWQRYRAGEGKLAQFFVGKVMKATRGRADGKAVVAELERLRQS